MLIDLIITFLPQHICPIKYYHAYIVLNCLPLCMEMSLQSDSHISYASDRHDIYGLSQRPDVGLSDCAELHQENLRMCR